MVVWSRQAATVLNSATKRLTTASPARRSRIVDTLSESGASLPCVMTKDLLAGSSMDTEDLLAGSSMDTKDLLQGRT
jgi:hypothetical protein